MCGVASAVDPDAGVPLGGRYAELASNKAKDGIARRTLGQVSLADLVVRGASHASKAGSDPDEM
jgi:hypothetical protein